MVYPEPQKVYPESQKVYPELWKVYPEPRTVYPEPQKVYTTPKSALRAAVRFRKDLRNQGRVHGKRVRMYTLISRNTLSHRGCESHAHPPPSSAAPKERETGRPQTHSCSKERTVLLRLHQRRPEGLNLHGD
ncbi:hypothetical protein E5288_WYG005115 [Bos mutus]|uniref:Uncharacterized protein n=1 Tax=Bos mutus TaxID=72004 RepID=A0A6B0RYS3_9CETA|nr:hypothetical protein [Bos mutus]